MKVDGRMDAEGLSRVLKNARIVNFLSRARLGQQALNILRGMGDKGRYP